MPVTLIAHTEPEPYLQATYAAQECGCRIVGNGTLPHPLDIERCPAHAGAVAVAVIREALFAMRAPGRDCREQAERLLAGFLADLDGGAP